MGKPALFLILWSISVVLPTNTEGLAEWYWAAAILALSWITRTQLPHRIPRIPYLAWILAIVSAILSSISSNSLAFSVTALVRYVEAFMLWSMFASPDRTEAKEIVTGLERAAIDIVILFVILLVLLSIGMNPAIGTLLYGVNGHHPIAYLLPWFIPLLWQRYLFHKNGGSLLALMLAVLSLFVSASRGAMIIIGMWIATALNSYPVNTRVRFGGTAILAGLLIAIGIMQWASYLPFEQKHALIRTAPAIALFIKEQPRQDPRTGFAYQAMNAMQTHWVWGYGPGTFSLASRAFQREPNTSSARAHSFVLQLVSEQGVIGSAFYLFLVGFSAYAAWRTLRTRPNTPESQLALPVLLTVLYGMGEITLDYGPVFFLFWPVCGILSRARSPLTDTSRLIQTLSLFLIGTYAVSFLGSGALLAKNNVLGSIIMAPYNKEITLSYLAKGDRDEIYRSLPVIMFIHRNDPDVLARIAGVETDAAKAAQLFARATALDPYNYQMRQAYLTRLLNHREFGAFAEHVCAMTRTFSPQAADSACTYAASTAFTELLSADGAANAVSSLQGADGLAKFYYFLGLSAARIREDTNAPLLLWDIARAVAPQWGYYYMELASAQYYWHNNPTEAMAVMKKCRTHPLARAGCRDVQSLDRLYAPGSLAPDITRIPNL